MYCNHTVVDGEHNKPFGQKPKFALRNAFGPSCEPSFLLMPMPSVTDFSWYNFFTRLLPDLVQILNFWYKFCFTYQTYGKFFFWYNFSGTISFSCTKTFGFAFGLRRPICVRSTRSAFPICVPQLYLSGQQAKIPLRPKIPRPKQGLPTLPLPGLSTLPLSGLQPAAFGDNDSRADVDGGWRWQFLGSRRAELVCEADEKELLPGAPRL